MILYLIKKPPKMDWRLRQTETVTDRNIKIHEKRGKLKNEKIHKIIISKFIEYFKKRSLIFRLLTKIKIFIKNVINYDI